MSFSEAWDNQYAAGSQMSIWPWSDLVSYFMRHISPISNELKVLELGCGAGANIPFFLNLGVNYYAIEGSDVIVKKLHERYPALKNNIIAGDFTQPIPFNQSFDVVVDRASVTHNTTAAIEKCLVNVHQLLRPSGKFIGIDWFSTMHSDFNKGMVDQDTYTKNNYSEGQFTGVGRVHFSDKKHLELLFQNFTFNVLEHKIIRKESIKPKHVFASWNFVATKR